MASVLIIDDEKLIAQSIFRVLGQAGYDANFKTSSIDGFREIQENYYDYALIDILMPDMSGTEIIKWIAKDRPETKIIAMTAYGSAHTEAELLSIGAQLVLFKPFEDIFKIADIFDELSTKLIVE